MTASKTTFLSSTIRSLGFSAVLAASLLSIHPAAVAIPTDSDKEQAKRIHDRLAGVPPTAAVLDTMAVMIENNDVIGAAREAMNNPSFYNVTLKNWASPWTNRDEDAFVPLNDYSALVIGLVRDGDTESFQQLLNGTVMYTGADLGNHSNSNNTHFEALEASGADMGDPAVLVRRQQTAVTGIDSAGAAGIFSTRAAARAFFFDGTNRAMIRFTLKDQLCHDMEQLKDVSLPAHRVRQDVSRSPGGDGRLFLTNCLACHNGMDPLAQAFAYYQFDYADDPDTGQLVYTPGSVQEKYLQNDSNFKEGYITPDDRWTNHWRQGVNVERLGWLNSIPANQLYTEGNGARTMGSELASSDAFATCQVKKAFRAVCLREPAEADRSLVDTTVANFKSGYNMKNVFAELAASCASHL